MFQDEVGHGTAALDTISTVFLETERTLGLLQGLHACQLAHSTPVSNEEEKCASILSADYMSGGLHSAEELEKSTEHSSGEDKSSQLRKAFQRQCSYSEHTRPFLLSLTEGGQDDGNANRFLSLINQ